MVDESPLPVCTGRLRRTVYLAAGAVCIVLGLLGVALPVLPTTPFLLLAAFFFARSSRRCYRWLVTNRVFGRYLYDYLCGRGVPWKVKAYALSLLWATIIFSSIFFVDALWLRVLLPTVAAGVTVHIAMLKGRRSAG